MRHTDFSTDVASVVETIQVTDEKQLFMQLRGVFTGITRMSKKELVATYQALVLLDELPIAHAEESRLLIEHMKRAILNQAVVILLERSEGTLYLNAFKKRFEQIIGKELIFEEYSL